MDEITLVQSIDNIIGHVVNGNIKAATEIANTIPPIEESNYSCEVYRVLNVAKSFVTKKDFYVSETVILRDWLIPYRNGGIDPCDLYDPEELITLRGSQTVGEIIAVACKFGMPKALSGAVKLWPVEKWLADFLSGKQDRCKPGSTVQVSIGMGLLNVCKNGHVEILHILAGQPWVGFILRSIADDLVTRMIALQKACIKGHSAIVKALGGFPWYCDKHVAEESGALIEACLHNHPDIVRILGAPPYSIGKESEGDVDLYREDMPNKRFSPEVETELKFIFQIPFHKDK